MALALAQARMGDGGQLLGHAHEFVARIGAGIQDGLVAVLLQMLDQGKRSLRGGMLRKTLKNRAMGVPCSQPPSANLPTSIQTACRYRSVDRRTHDARHKKVKETLD